jgi:DNA-binding MarR family transcriptional regulator
MPLDNIPHEEYCLDMVKDVGNRDEGQAPRGNPEREVFVLLQKVAGQLVRDVEELLKPSRLSPSQFNVLRILRGAGPEGIACRAIAERMITRDPDLTRLLDRLEKRNLVARARMASDRRVVRTSITEAGLALLRTLDHPVDDLHVRHLGHLGRERLDTLSDLLKTAQKRGGIE